MRGLGHQGPVSREAPALKASLAVDSIAGPNRTNLPCWFERASSWTFRSPFETRPRAIALVARRHQVLGAFAQALLPSAQHRSPPFHPKLHLTSARVRRPVYPAVQSPIAQWSPRGQSSSIEPCHTVEAGISHWEATGSLQQLWYFLSSIGVS
jgi:hypothetical protein